MKSLGFPSENVSNRQLDVEMLSSENKPRPEIQICLPSATDSTGQRFSNFGPQTLCIAIIQGACEKYR